MGTPRRTGLDADAWRFIEHQLATRSQSACEACGEPFVAGRREPNIHHRRTRGMGGTRREDVNGLANLLLLCAGFSRKLGGTLGCHGLVTNDPGRIHAAERGLVVGQAQVPADVALVLHSGRRVLLDDAAPFYLTPTDGLLWDLTAVAA